MAVLKDGKLSAWSDTLDSMIQAGEEYAKSYRAPRKLVSEKYGTLYFDADCGLPNEVYTDSEQIKDYAFGCGYWVQEWKTPAPAKWQIYFGCSCNPNKPPNRLAIHRDVQR